MTIIYKQIFIKTEADLPKEDGEYFCETTFMDIHLGEIRTINTLAFFDTTSKAYRNEWINTINWYLQPIEITDSDIEAWAEKLDIQDLDVELTQHELIERKIGAIMGARAIRDGKIKHI